MKPKISEYTTKENDTAKRLFKNWSSSNQELSIYGLNIAYNIPKSYILYTKTNQIAYTNQYFIYYCELYAMIILMNNIYYYMYEKL